MGKEQKDEKKRQSVILDTDFPDNSNSNSSSSLRGKSSRACSLRNVCTGFTLLLGILLVSGGIFVLLHFRTLVDKIIQSKIRLHHASPVTRAWLDPPIQPVLKVYFFNMTNVEDFKNGAKPNLVEVGPYVYEQNWTKVDVSWSASADTVSYRQQKLFFFNRALSVGSEDDVLTLPNVPVISSIGGRMRFAGKLIRLALGSMLEILRKEAFTTVTVRDILWGFPDPLVQLGNDVLPDEEKFPHDEFGFFVGKNGSKTGLLTMQTGMPDVSQVGKILSWNGQEKLDFWTPETHCNNIRGTDGSVFSPGLTKNDTLYIFNRELCQSLPLRFQEEVDVHGIPAYRFVPAPDVFGTPEENPDNSCFCVASSGCSTPSGLFNMTQCQYGTPIMLSWPHFFQADPRLLHTVQGLEPSARQHQFFIDVQPKLGKTLRAQARTQINVVISGDQDIKAAKGLRDIILPILWFSDGVEDLDDPDSLRLLRAAIFTPETARTVMYPTLLILGTLILLAVLLLLLRRHLNDSPAPGHRAEKRPKNGPRSALAEIDSDLAPPKRPSRSLHRPDDVAGLY